MSDTELDLRQIPPPQRHALVFSTWEALDEGDSFVLVNDHDPNPLRNQFNLLHRGRFTWDYLESGPQVWRVEIGRTAR